MKQAKTLKNRLERELKQTKDELENERIRGERKEQESRRVLGEAK